MSNPTILTVTEGAINQIRELQHGDVTLGIRIAVVGDPTPMGYRTELGFMQRTMHGADDVVQDVDDVWFIMDKTSAEALQGAVIDFDETKFQGGFHIQYAPDKLVEVPPSKMWGDELSTQVQKVIDNRLNPGLKSHNGFVELLEVRGEKAYIEMGGGCKGCAGAFMTLKQGIEKAIFAEVPEIKEVLDVTEHADGTNPYYTEVGGQGVF